MNRYLVTLLCISLAGCTAAPVTVPADTLPRGETIGAMPDGSALSVFKDNENGVICYSLIRLPGRPEIALSCVRMVGGEE